MIERVYGDKDTHLTSAAEKEILSNRLNVLPHSKLDLERKAKNQTPTSLKSALIFKDF
jgi:hypothetical protein